MSTVARESAAGLVMKDAACFPRNMQCVKTTVIVEVGMISPGSRQMGRMRAPTHDHQAW